MKKIVVIDDEVDFCRLVKLQCDKKDINCEYATSLNEGIELLQNVQPSVVILDNNLPDGLGWQKASRILQEFPNTTLHLVTAKLAADMAEREAANKPRLFYHNKPLSLADIEAILL